MSVDRPTREQRDPTPPARHAAAGRWQDWLFEHTTLFFALFVLATAARHPAARSLIAAMPALAEVRPRLLLHQRLESGHQQLRRAGADLRHAGHVGDRAADRRAGELRHRAVPDRDVPGVAQAAARHGGRAAGGDPVDHLRHVGAVRVRAAVRRLRAAAADQRRSATLLDPRAAVPGRAQRHRHAHRPASSCRS